MGWETVKVPAGTFRGLHVFESGGGASWGWRSDYWYVPSVKAWVKFDYHERGGGYEEELVSWRFPR